MAQTASGFYLYNDGGFVVSMHVLYVDDEGMSQDDRISGNFPIAQGKSETLDPNKIPLGVWVRLKVWVEAGDDNTAAENFKFDPNGPIQGYKISGSTLNNSLQYTGPRK
ncbi:hypothetical protein [Paraliomyxa miuraensis]|uniref:hypothetical protein n=1 Tax=Paraliomyxa miuraensis TaxID=376150 RepID=UPI002259AD00|nr:hypothetical protein [Paraliomyxa miuraensis]MCX4247274.1 hypothetical protein [Paraliomyxa miuraensis]